MTMETLPALLDPLRRALEAVKTFSEVRDIHARAEAMRAFAQSRGEAIEQINHWTEWRLRAERRMGEELAKLEMHSGRPKSYHAGSILPPLEELGVSHNQSSRWQVIASIPESDFEAHIAAARELGVELSSAGLRRVAKARDPATPPQGSRGSHGQEPNATPPEPDDDEIGLHLRRLVTAWNEACATARELFLEQLTIATKRPDLAKMKGDLPCRAA